MPGHERLTDTAEGWPVHGSEEIWHGHAPFSIRRDAISRPGHEEQFHRLVVDHPGAAAVLAIDEDERALVIQQYRHPAGIRFVELPAGLLDVPGEDPMVAAKRELLEEGACTASRWSHLATTYPSPGLSSERIEIYRARGLTHVPDRGGFELTHEEADMTLSWVPLQALVAGVLSRRLTDGPLAVAVLTHVMGERRRD